MAHERWIRRCLELAERGRGFVGNGAMVGAALVRDGKVIAEGHHESFGMAHAERALLEAYSGAIQPTDTLYVNLEPCCHHGKTPPCTDILVERGVKHVVYGMRDPDLRVSGQGIMALERAGVECTPVARAACEWFNRGFVSVRTNERPWITLKQAVTGDGRIAKPDGTPLKITRPEQDVWSHTVLRAKHDAILVGAGTILSDNPSLTVRHADVPVQPYRIILDPHLRTPTDATIVTDAHASRTILVVCEAAGVDRAKVQQMKDRGIRLVDIDMTGTSRFAFHDLWPHLLNADGDFHGLTSILVEGGAKTWQYVREAGIVDAEVVLTSA